MYERLGIGAQTDLFIQTWETLYTQQRQVEGIRCKAGARALLEFLKHLNVPVVVATSSQHEHAANKLAQSGLHTLLHAVVTSSDVVAGKPDPEIFLRGAALAGVDPRNCLALEDSDVGVEAALSAGMRVIQVPDLVSPRHKIDSPRLEIMSSLERVKRYIETIHPGP